MDLPVSNYVLLVDARRKRVSTFSLKVAALLPETSFLAIASRSPLADAIEAANELLPNVAIIHHVEDMDAVYREALAVAVPRLSHRGRLIWPRVHRSATLQRCRCWVRPRQHPLSRWSIRASFFPKTRRYGPRRSKSCPTIPLGYYREHVRKARRNSARYSHKAQRGIAPCDRVSADTPILVGAGGGLGNMLHTTPMIRNIARRMRRPVDVVAAEDHSNSLCLMHHPEYVGTVYALRQLVLARRYDTVFLTHSFGPMRVAFNSDNVIWAADWREYRPIEEHETRYNLDAAKDLLKIPYRDDDLTGYFCGDLEYQQQLSETLRRLHAGSKTGRWLVKRWPHFAELAARLTGRGIRVASFGTADVEYVEGTENRTGATIESMCESMLECSHFVANDSGVMNIANALGIPTLALFAPTNVEARLPLRPSTRAGSCSTKTASPASFSTPRRTAKRPVPLHGGNRNRPRGRTAPGHDMGDARRADRHCRTGRAGVGGLHATFGDPLVFR